MLVAMQLYVSNGTPDAEYIVKPFLDVFLDCNITQDDARLTSAYSEIMVTLHDLKRTICAANPVAWVTSKGDVRLDCQAIKV